jgi:hypothetical protein
VIAISETLNKKERKNIWQRFDGDYLCTPQTKKAVSSLRM